jgi:polysaccharide biosynthesis protein PslG
MNQQIAHRNAPSKRVIVAAAAVVILIFSGLLVLDLANQGLAWRLFWSLTGEETPAAQIRGMIEWLGNATRAQPNTEPNVPINDAGVNPYGINTFLEQEVEPAKREQQVRMIAEAGFHWIRQQFPWQDIEIDGRGDFIDRRHPEITGEISAWDKYDQIVDLTEQYGLEIEARLDTPPAWARTAPDAGTLGPADDLQDYINFVTTFAERYKGRIHVYQIWNEPNIYPEWGERAVNPEGYTEMLCGAFAALKAVDPEIRVMSAALSPTLALSERDLNEFIFLQRMYDAGAGECFDILAAQGYGFFSGPTDQRMRPTTVTFARNLYLRDIMVANGDADKPIWISEAAWNPVDSPEVPEMADKLRYGSATREQAARYMPLAYQRAQQEWSWVGVINYWFFKRASDAGQDDPSYYFRMVEPDFTPLPVYDAMKNYIASETPTLYVGVHEADDRAITHDDAAEIVRSSGAQFETALSAQTVTFTFHGTDASIRWIGTTSDTLNIRVDGQEWGTSSAIVNVISSRMMEADDWTEIAIHHSLTAETHTVELSSADGFQLDSVSVYDRAREHLTPIVAGGAAVGVLAVIGIGWALWKRIFG